jgi:hypothetical protein
MTFWIWGISIIKNALDAQYGLRRLKDAITSIANVDVSSVTSAELNLIEILVEMGKFGKITFK